MVLCKPIDRSNCEFHSKCRDVGYQYVCPPSKQAIQMSKCMRIHDQCVSATISFIQFIKVCRVLARPSSKHKSQVYSSNPLPTAKPSLLPACILEESTAVPPASRPAPRGSPWHPPCLPAPESSTLPARRPVPHPPVGRADSRPRRPAPWLARTRTPPVPAGP